MHEIKTCEEALKLSQLIEQDDDNQSINSRTDNEIEDRLE